MCMYEHANVTLSVNCEKSYLHLCNTRGQINIIEIFIDFFYLINLVPAVDLSHLKPALTDVFQSTLMSDSVYVF